MAAFPLASTTEPFLHLYFFKADPSEHVLAHFGAVPLWD
jgi:hypothetical protein